MFHLVSCICIPQNEMVVVHVASDLNGYVGSSNVDWMHGGYGDRNADGSTILEFADGRKLVICNTCSCSWNPRWWHMQLVLLKKQLIILLCDRRTKERFIMSR